MSSIKDFLSILPASIIRHSLVTDYFLGRGYPLDELQYLGLEYPSCDFNNAFCGWLNAQISFGRGSNRVTDIHTPFY